MLGAQANVLRRQEQRRHIGPRCGQGRVDHTFAAAWHPPTAAGAGHVSMSPRAAPPPARPGQSLQRGKVAGGKVGPEAGRKVVQFSHDFGYTLQMFDCALGRKIAHAPHPVANAQVNVVSRALPKRDTHETASSLCTAAACATNTAALASKTSSGDRGNLHRPATAQAFLIRHEPALCC